jgi:hypothetical protein
MGGPLCALATRGGDGGRGGDALCDGRYGDDDPYGAGSNVDPKDCKLVPKKARQRERSQPK